MVHLGLFKKEETKRKEEEKKNNLVNKNGKWKIEKLKWKPQMEKLKWKPQTWISRLKQKTNFENTAFFFK